MIERMIISTKKFLPLKISTINWNGTQFHMYSEKWAFYSLSSWRITRNNKINFGCDDNNSVDLIKMINNQEIIDIEIQDNLLKIDPVFILSNDSKLEFFSTDTYEPWTFFIKNCGFYDGFSGKKNYTHFDDKFKKKAVFVNNLSFGFHAAINNMRSASPKFIDGFFG